MKDRSAMVKVSRNSAKAEEEKERDRGMEGIPSTPSKATDEHIGDEE